MKHALRVWGSQAARSVGICIVGVVRVVVIDYQRQSWGIGMGEGASESADETPWRTRAGVVAVCGVGALLVAIVWIAAVVTAPERDALRTYTRLVTAANRGDVEAVQGLCTTRFLSENPPRLADEGGLVGLPRAIHKNYQIWRSGRDIHICPSNRVGVVFRMVRSGEAWLFDGLVGVTRR